MDEIATTIIKISLKMIIAPILIFIAGSDFNFWKDSKIDEFFKFASMRRDIRKLKRKQVQTPFWRAFLFLNIGFGFLLSLSIYIGIFGFIVGNILKIFS